MKINTKNVLVGILIAAFLSFIAILMCVLTEKSTTACAATYSDSGRYELNVGATMNAGYNAKPADYHIYLYGNSTSSNTTFIYSDSILKFAPTKLEIVIPAGSSSKYHTVYGRVYNINLQGPVAFSFGGVYNGSATGSSELPFTMYGLKDGKYTFSFTTDVYYYNSTNIGGTNSGYRDEEKHSFSFIVDTLAPEIEGASKDITNNNVNISFTVRAKDDASGVKAIYMKTPSSSLFRSAGTSNIVINQGDENGRYTFFAEDFAGNKSDYYYVNFDDICPEISCIGASFGTNANSEFTVLATDNLGKVTLYYKFNESNWTSGGSSYFVSDAAEEGMYYFYAVDDSGNRTSEKWIQFGAEISGEFVKSDTDNTVFFTWDRPSWTATLDGVEYTKGTWIRDEGEHTIKLSSKTKSAFYPFKIDHYYNEHFEKPTCTHGGYLRYDCVQCGDSYTDYSIEETGHYYVASTTAATCTSGGYTVYTCTRCGDSYTDNYTNPLGHNYESVYKPATCTDYGKTVFTCQVCGNGYYETDGTLPTGHSYINKIITAPTCTTDGLRRISCEKCEYSLDTAISANGHNYNITETITTQGTTVRHYSCTICSHSYTQELGDQYEEITNYVEYMFEQYEPYMWWVLFASAGVWSIAIGVMIAIAHKNDEKEKAKKMLVNYVIGLVVIAIIVVACPFLLRGIAALIT